MTMQEDARQMIGFHVITSDDEDLGTVERVYLDNRTHQPEFVSVKSGGLFGRRESLVPLQGSHVSGEQLRLPFDKQKIKDAPDVGNSKDISPQEGEQLYDHYGLRSAGVPAQQTGEADRMGDGDQAGDRTDAAAGIGTAAAAGAGTAAVAGVASHHGADAKPDTPETGAAPDTDMKAGTGMDADAPSARMPGAPAAAMVGHTGLDDPAPASDRMAESLDDRTADASPGLGADSRDDHLTSGDDAAGGPGGLSAAGAEPMASSATHDAETSGDAPAASAGMAGTEHAEHGTDAGHSAEAGGDSAGGKGAALAAGGAGAAYAAHRAKSSDAEHAADVGHAPDTAETSAMADRPGAEHATETPDTAMDKEKSPDGMEGMDATDAGHAEHSGAPRTVAIPQQGIRLIREPIAEGEQLTEADHGENVIIVYAERLVVSTVRVPVERVRVVKAGDASGSPQIPTDHAGTSTEPSHDLSHEAHDTAHGTGSIS